MYFGFVEKKFVVVKESYLKCLINVVVFIYFKIRIWMRNIFMKKKINCSRFWWLDGSWLDGMVIKSKI